ncbi:MAG: SsrA-binding protein [Bdellovibrionales bacterium RBG_16_40_8]|nr:MAG: SsrA-binding protein [Bdellovibrionales bacterium RBG_16_40_8]
MGIKIIVENKKARHDYHILENYEAGIVLMGSEVKSLRQGQCNLKDSYVSFVGDEIFLQKAHISPYTASSYNNHNPERLRKLLLSRSEINKIHTAMSEKGLTCIPLKMYFSKGRVKVDIALAKGKNKGDKRADIKKRDVNREMRRALRHEKK